MTSFIVLCMRLLILCCHLVFISRPAMSIFKFFLQTIILISVCMVVVTCQFCLIAVRGQWQQCLSSSHPHVLFSLFRHVCECPNNYNIPLNGFVNGFQITPGVCFLFFSMGWQLALQIRGQVLFDFVLLFLCDHIWTVQLTCMQCQSR